MEDGKMGNGKMVRLEMAIFNGEMGNGEVVFLLGIFRRAPRPSDARRAALMPFYFPGVPCPLKKVY
jgi:hypothetical protein